MSATEQHYNSSKEQENQSDLVEAKTEPGKRDSTLPRRFGRLTLLRQLARGGMGEVFLAASGGIEGAERPTVVKIIRRDHKNDESFLARFLDEARIQAQLQHPGVAQILEATQDEEGDPHVVVEYVEGRNLAEVRSRATQLGMRLNWPEALAVAISMADALAHVHERTDASGRPLQIVHRDLSPQNVMVSYSGDTKLIDFGTARGQNRKCHTVSGIVFAKPGYVAPEVANNTPGGVPADLYAFGIMLWELLAGRRFLSGEASSHLAQVAVGKRNPAPLAQLTGAPDELDRVIAKLTAPRIEDRYSSARDALSDLVSVLKKAPSMADGDRSVRGRIAQLMQRMYPAEPARSRAEFARLVAHARDVEVKPSTLPAPSPEPALAEEEAASDLLPGTRFRLIREIGRGGMGTVYEACHVDLGRTVALKVLTREHSMNAQRMNQFRAEARVVAGLQHENLVKVHEFGVAQDGRAYYTMDLLEGQSLAQYIDQFKGMDWREAAGLGIQACRALEVAHDAGVIHSDIKPANLFLTQDNVVKLLDFGIAKVGSGAERGDMGESEAIHIVGTPEYLAPEQAKGLDPDARTDVYALGSVLYELVTGRLPHHANTTVELLDLKSNVLPESPRQRAPQRGLPPMLDKAIMNSLRTDPGDRFQTAAELREALEAALREPERRRQRRRRVGLAAVGVLAVLCGVGAGMVTAKPELRSRLLERAGTIAAQIRAVRAQSSSAALAQAANEAADEKRQALQKPAAASNPASLGESPSDADEGDGEKATSDVVDLDQEQAEVGALAEAQGSAKDEAQAAASAPETSAASTHPEASDELMSMLVQAEQQMEEGNRIKAFNSIKRLARKHPKDPRAQRALSQSAVRMKAWGLAHRAAAQWVEIEPTVEARIQLAKMERATSRGNYRSTLKKVLAEQPDNAEAAELLGGTSKKVASRD